jgi:Na+/proline symporter
MPTDHFLDAAVVVVYLLLSFAFGVLASRWFGADNSREKDYFLAGRKVPGWLAGTSVGVTSMNADVAPAYAGMALVVGLPMAWFYLSRFGFALLIGAILFAWKWRQLALSTGPEFFALRFGGRGGRFVRVWQSVYGVAIGMVPWIGAGLLGVHKIFAPVFGYEEIALTLAVVLPVLILYVWISGYSGVLATDLVQSIIILVANLILMGLVLLHFGGPSGLAGAIREALPPAQAAEALSPTPIANHPVLGLLAVIPWFIISTIGFGGNVTTDGQRLLSCRTPRESMKAYIWSQVVLFLMLLTLTLPVLGLLPLQPELYRASPAEREQAYGMLLREFMPAGLLGLALAALSAAVMSTISSHLNYGAQTLVNDSLRTFVPDLSERRGILAGRLAMLVIMAASIVVVYQSESLIGLAITLGGFFASTITFAWGQWWWWRANFAAWVAAMVFGPAIYLTLSWWLPQLPAIAEFASRGPEEQQLLGLATAVAGMLLSTIVWVTTALLTKPGDMAVLKDFYQRARPMGLWGPVREALLADGVPLPPARPMIAPGLAVAALGSGWIAAAVVGLGQLYVAQWVGALVTLAMAGAMAYGFKHAFDWYVKRLSAET